MQAQEYNDIMKEYRLLVEARLGDIERSTALTEGVGIYPTLRKAMFYSLEAGGKRLRPCLLLAVCELLGGDTDMALPIACGLEMIHTYSLIHDDLPCMDDDDFRRGKPSNHKVFGEAMAVLAGDGLLSLAFETMLKGAEGLDGEALKNYLKAVNEVASRAGSGGMVSGQAADIVYEGEHNQTEEMLAYIHTHKTADMLCAAVLAGAYAAGAGDEMTAMLKIYAQKLGLLFQITDDVLDFQGEAAALGKTPGKDEASGKLTYATLYGVEGAKQKARITADEAKAAVSDVKNNGLLLAVIDNILYRSF